MFPIPFNFPFRKANGDISTIGAEIGAGGGGSSYTLPTASAETLGGIKVGSNLSIDESGVLSASGGGSSYTLPTASAETKGGIKIGAGLSMDGEVLNNSNPTAYTLPTASAETKGGVKVGSGLSIDGDGVLSASGGSTETWDTIWTNSDLSTDIANKYIELTLTSGVEYDEIVISYYRDKQNQSMPFYMHIEINNHIRLQEVSANLIAGDNTIGQSGSGIPYIRCLYLDLRSSNHEGRFLPCYKMSDYSTANNYCMPRWIRARRKPTT